MTQDEKTNILLSLSAEDCCQIEPNNSPGYGENVVYVFIKDAELFCYGEPQTVNLYIKMYIRETKTYDTVIVISFHEEGMHDL